LWPRRNDGRNEKAEKSLYKVKIALEAIKGQQTVNELASQYGAHANFADFWYRQSVVP
jgi:transposase-like protein